MSIPSGLAKNFDAMPPHPGPLLAWGRIPRSDSRIEPLNLPMPGEPPNLNVARLLSPLRSHSEWEGREFPEEFAH